MTIGDILKVTQPDIHKKLSKSRQNKMKNKKDNTSFSDMEKLMGNRSYKRGKGGSIRQVR